MEVWEGEWLATRLAGVFFYAKRSTNCLFVSFPTYKLIINAEKDTSIQTNRDVLKHTFHSFSSLDSLQVQSLFKKASSPHSAI
jgi:hypothetical protein